MIKRVAQKPSQTDGAITMEFTNVASLETCVASRVCDSTSYSMQYLSPGVCKNWERAGNEERGYTDPLSIESVTRELVTKKDPSKEAVIVLRITANGETLSKPFLLPFL